MFNYLIEQIQVNMFSYAKQIIIEFTFKKPLILIAFQFLINPFFISQNTSDCFLFEISHLELKNSNRGPIKNIPEELKCFRTFKKQLNELLNIKRVKFYYIDSILKDIILLGNNLFKRLICSCFISGTTSKESYIDGKISFN